MIHRVNGRSAITHGISLALKRDTAHFSERIDPMRFWFFILSLLICIQPNIAAHAKSPDAIRQDAQEHQRDSFVFKGFYLEMPLEDAQILLNASMGLDQASTEIVGPLPTSLPGSPPGMAPGSDAANAMAMIMGMYEASAKGVKVHNMEEHLQQKQEQRQRKPFRIYRHDGQLVLAQNGIDRPFAVAGSDGKVKEFSISVPVREKLFQAKGLTRDEFLQAFVNAYAVTSLTGDVIQLKTRYMGMEIESGVQGIYHFRSPKGYEVVYYGDVAFRDPDLGALTPHVPPEHLIIRCTATPQFN
ncbi:MAG: hypothetical protein M0O99_01835 [Desulfuromonas thiophila]|nr:hypothetical protein [Desulfuromonas thiophila]